MFGMIKIMRLSLLTLNVGPCIPENCIEIKINLNFYFHTFLWCLKRFYEVIVTERRKDITLLHAGIMKIILCYLEPC